MTSVSAVPSHLLLTRKDEAASHDTRPDKRGASSAFATYAFGPLDTSKGKDVTNTTKPIAGTSSVTAATGGIGWLTQLAASNQRG